MLSSNWLTVRIRQLITNYVDMEIGATDHANLGLPNQPRQLQKGLEDLRNCLVIPAFAAGEQAPRMSRAKALACPDRTLAADLLKRPSDRPIN